MFDGILIKPLFALAKKRFCVFLNRVNLFFWDLQTIEYFFTYEFGQACAVDACANSVSCLVTFCCLSDIFCLFDFVIWDIDF